MKEKKILLLNNLNEAERLKIWAPPKAQEHMLLFKCNLYVGHICTCGAENTEQNEFWQGKRKKKKKGRGKDSFDISCLAGTHAHIYR